MKILMAYSSKQLGCDPVVEQLYRHLQSLKHEVYVADIELVQDNAATVQQHYDFILLMDALDWYIQNRIKLIGRPKVCMWSTCFETLMPLLVHNVTTLGIDSFITNCPTFFDQISKVMPTTFSHKPVLASPAYSTFSMIGAVLPNVADRDFSMLARTWDIVKKQGKKDRFLLALPVNETKRLPPAFTGLNIVRYSGFQEASALLDSLGVTVLCPRITDYRAGIFPPEILFAAKHKAQPLLIHHQNLTPLEGFISPIAKSLKEFDELVVDALKRTQVVDTRVVPDRFAPTVESFASILTKVME